MLHASILVFLIVYGILFFIKPDYLHPTLYPAISLVFALMYYMSHLRIVLQKTAE